VCVPEMHKTRKGNQWCFGMKNHVGADVNSVAVHSVTTIAVNVADVTASKFNPRRRSGYLCRCRAIRVIYIGTALAIWGFAGV